MCACIQAYRALFQRYTAQTCTELASNFLTIGELLSIPACSLVAVKKEEYKQVFERVSVHTGAITDTGFQMLAPAKDAGDWDTCVSVHSHTSISDVYRCSLPRSTLDMSASEYVYLLC